MLHIHVLRACSKQFRILFFFCMLCFCQPVGDIRAQGLEVSLYNDPRVLAWSKDFLAGNREQVIQSVEKDLKSPSPHPFAAHVWTVTQYSLGRLKQARASVKDEELLRSLGPLPDVLQLYVAGEYQKAITAYPPSRAAEIKDVWTLQFLAYSAKHRHRDQDKLAYITALLRLRRDLFDVPWLLYELAEDDDRMRPQILALTEKTGLLSDTPAGKFLTEVLRFRPSDPLEEIYAVERWLEVYPNDSRALRFMAFRLSDAKYWDDTVEMCRRAREAYPFGQWGMHYNMEGTALVYLNKKAETRETANLWAKVATGDAAEVDPLATEALAEALSDAGELGQARRLLTDAQNKWPKRAIFYSQMAELESKSGRVAQALEMAQKAAQKEPENLHYQLQLIKLQKENKKLSDALALWQQTDKRFQQKSEDFYAEGQEILSELKRTEERAQINRRAVAEFPDSPSMLRILAESLYQAGRPEEAIEKLRASIDIDSDNKWAYENLRDYLTAQGGAEKADAEMDALRKRFPWSEAMWEEASAHAEEKDGGKGQFEVLRQAMEASSFRAWAFSDLILMLADVELWKDADGIINIMIQAAPFQPAGDRAYAQILQVIFTQERIRKGAASIEDVKKAWEALQKYIDMGGSPASYYKYASKLLMANRQNQDAWEAANKAMRFDPDDGGLLFDMFTIWSGKVDRATVERMGFKVDQKELDQLVEMINEQLERPDSSLFVKLHRYVDRNYYDDTRLQRAAQLHILYGGSNIVGLQLLNELRQRGSDKYRSDFEADAWANLGDNRKAYEMNYGQNTIGVAHSDRYVYWFDQARYRAQKEANHVDASKLYSEGIVTVTYPDGRRETWQDHPVSGKRTLLQIDKAYVRAEYDEEGLQLNRIICSSGIEVNITYNADGMMQGVATSDGEEVQLKWEPDKDKEGAMRATYVLKSGGKDKGVQPFDVVKKYIALLDYFETRERGKLPDIPLKDPALETLRADRDRKELAYTAQKSPENEASLMQAKVALARHLVAHLKDRNQHSDDAHTLLESAISAGRSKGASTALVLQAGEAIALWHELMRTTRESGLGASDWLDWNQMRNWLRDTSETSSTDGVRLRAIFRKIDDEPLTLLDSANWLPRSYIDNPGFWRRFRVAEMLSPMLRTGAKINTIFVRRNNDVVVGTSVGLCVLRRGFWEWFGFDEAASRFSSTLAPDFARGKPTSDVLALAEDAQGAMWVGTARGLVRLPSAYDGEAEVLTSPQQGLPVARTSYLLAYKDGVLVGTSAGLRLITNGQFTPVEGLESEATTFLRAPMTEGSNVAITIVGTPQAVYGLVGGKAVKLAEGNITDALWHPAEKKVFLLRNGQVYTVDWDGVESPGRMVALNAQQNVLKNSLERYGLSAIPLDDGQMAVTVMTDVGLFIYHDNHFEQRKLPYADRTASVSNLVSRNQRSYLLTSEGIYALERGQAMSDRNGEVSDILCDDAQGKVFIARGDRLEVIEQKNIGEGTKTFDKIAAEYLAQDKEGRLIVNDGVVIKRYAKGTSKAEEIFKAEPLQEDGKTRGGGRVTSLIVTTDGAIWVTSGSSTFRWLNGKLDEFSIYIDDKRFPIRTNWCSKVVETVDHRIWVVGSSEGHFRHLGVELEGGMVEWDGSAFRRLDLSDETEAWFIRGYTPIDDSTAIVASSAGFAQHKRDGFASYLMLKDAAYKALTDRIPQAWMGTRGARLGKDVWLFGSAGGVVGYRAGMWFYPDRLNYMLPDDHLSHYGSRTVRTVATDRDGRIYVGTDRGLLVYDSGGGDPAAFLISNYYDQLAFKSVELDKLRREADILLSSINPASEQGAALQQARQLQRDIQKLEEQVYPGARLNPPATSGRSAGDILSVGEREKLRQELTALRAKNTKLLNDIQEKFPSLYQMLELRPLETDALRHKLTEKQAILQFLPTDKTLYIQVVMPEGTAIREVNVTASELYERASSAAKKLSVGRGSRRDVTRVGQGASDDPKEDLAWLYKQLLYPVEDLLTGREQIFIVPVGGLTYVPFSALIRAQGERPQYAVEKYSFGYLPSMYLFDLVLRHQDSGAKDSLIIGDPDGTLPGAKAEAEVIRRYLGGELDPFIGPAATYSALQKNSGRAGVLHLATHGHLDTDSPGNSWLLFADRRMKLVEVLNLDLRKTSMVVLSACETGIGKGGMEYATLARAFAHAGSSSVVATLWKVNDASSKRLVEGFYKQHTSGADRFTALARAQRDMLESGDPNISDPSAWASYVVFGKP
jgi:CHAT domain-containing protein/predicted Zn-dependent protease